jgi:hypothetical protein
MIFSIVTPLYANEVIGTPPIEVVDEIAITPNTIITKENIQEVLEYVGLSSKNLIKDSSIEVNNVYTVGELSKAIEESKLIRSTATIAPVNETPVENFASKATAGTKTVSSTMYYSNSYYVTYRASGGYSGSKWTSSGTGSADVDTNSVVTTYKISAEDYDVTHTSSNLKLQFEITVDGYVGVGDIGLIKTSSNDITGTINFLASVYL